MNIDVITTHDLSKIGIDIATRTYYFTKCDMILYRVIINDKVYKTSPFVGMHDLDEIFHHISDNYSNYNQADAGVSIKLEFRHRNFFKALLGKPKGYIQIHYKK